MSAPPENVEVNPESAERGYEVTDALRKEALAAPADRLSHTHRIRLQMAVRNYAQRRSRGVAP